MLLELKGRQFLSPLQPQRRQLSGFRDGDSPSPVQRGQSATDLRFAWQKRGIPVSTGHSLIVCSESGSIKEPLARRATSRPPLSNT